MCVCVALPHLGRVADSLSARTRGRCGITPDCASRRFEMDADHQGLRPRRGFRRPSVDGAAFVIRIRCADVTKIPAHWHPTDEYIAVLKRVFFAGMGETFHESKLTPIHVGSCVRMPKQMRHFALNQGPDCRAGSRRRAVQGPWGEPGGGCSSWRTGKSKIVITGRTSESTSVVQKVLHATIVTLR